MGTRPAQTYNAFLREGCSILMRFHMPFVWLPAKQTKAVTMGAPLNKYGFAMFFWLTKFRSLKGFSALQKAL